MSQWTHVSGCIRVDAIPAVGLIPNLRAMLGDPSPRDHDRPDWHSGKGIPSGSEGSIQYETIDAGDGLVWKTVAVWGDLRDFGPDDTHEIDEWFSRIVTASALQNVGQTRLMLRSALLLVEVEYGPRYVLVGEHGTVRRTELDALSPVSPA